MWFIFQIEGDLRKSFRDVRDTLRTDFEYLRKDYIQRIQLAQDAFSGRFDEMYIRNQIIELDEMNNELKKMEGELKKAPRATRPKPTPLPLKTIKEGQIIKKPRKKSK